MSIDDLQLQKFENSSYSGYQGYHPRTATAGNIYDSGLPNARVVHGREHKILTDGSGAEVIKAFHNIRYTFAHPMFYRNDFNLFILLMYERRRTIHKLNKAQRALC